MSRTNLLLAALAAVAWGCGDRGLKSEDTSGPGQIDGAGTKSTPAAPLGSGSSVVGDLGGLASLSPAGAKAKAPDAGPATTPEEKAGLRTALDEALADGRFDEAIATADVLNVLFPDDPEILELRGRALARQGEPDGGASDLARCCELGRAACCGGKKR